MPSPTPRPSFFRTAAQYLTEPHPYGRKPVTMAPAKIAWEIYPRRVAKTGAFMFPMAVLVLGWPLAGKWMFNGGL